MNNAIPRAAPATEDAAAAADNPDAALQARAERVVRRRAKSTATAPVPASIPPHLQEVASRLPVMCRYEDCELTGYSTRTWRRAVARGDVRAVAPNRGAAPVTIPRSEVIRWLTERSR